MAYARLLKRLSVAKLQQMLAEKRRQQKIAPLEWKRDRLLKRAAKIQKKIDRLAGKEAELPGRPRKKRRFSASARRKIAAALRRHWANVRAKKKARVNKPMAGRKAGGRAKAHAAASTPAVSAAPA